MNAGEQAQNASAEILCGYRHAPLEKRLDTVEADVKDLIKAVSAMKGAWKMAVILGSVAGGFAATIATIAVELILRGHGP